MKTVFVLVDVPEDEYCESQRQKSWDCNRIRWANGRVYCKVDDRMLFYDACDRLKKTPACLASPVPLDCGHHPDALVTVDKDIHPPFCSACENERLTKEGR